MMNKIKQLLTPIPTATYSLFPHGLKEALISLANGTQAFIYLTISKFCITLCFLLHALTTCEVSESHSIACVLLLYEGFCLVHYNHYKKEIVNIEKLTQIYQLMDQSMIEQPLRVSQSQIVMALKKIILAQTPDLHRDSKYLMLLAQVIIIRFFVILTDYPFNYNIFHYFQGVCDESLLNVVFIMVLVIFLEFIVIYIVLAALIFAFPALGCLFLVRKLQKAYQIYKVKRHFQSFPTHKYTGIEDNWATEEKSCCICMSEYQNNETLLKLPCTGNHIFHEACIRNWLQISTDCPLCRQNLQ